MQRMEDVATPRGGGRTREEVEVAAVAAGLSLTSSSRTELLRFSEQLNSDEVRLMEMPLEVLDAIKHGESAVIRGEPGENAVLCTGTMTYELRVADTSNTLLLIPSLTNTQEEDGEMDLGEMPFKEVTACLSSYYELRPCRPRTEKLKQLLSECLYQGPEYESALPMEDQEGEEEDEVEEERGEGSVWDQKKLHKTEKKESVKTLPIKYTLSDLLDLVQASEAELRDSLEKLHACLIDGHWRILDPDYRDRVMQHILTLLEEQAWSWESVPCTECCQYLIDLEPSFIIEHCLKCYGNKINESGESNTETYYELSEEKVCQFYAELLLRQAGKFNYHEFIESWQQSVPDGMNTNLYQLKGLALSDMSTMPPVIWYFPASNLPPEPANRFNYLFSVRERWADTDIEPYIRDLATPTQSLNALLLKYVRVSTGVKGQKFFNAKRKTLTFK